MIGKKGNINVMMRAGPAWHQDFKRSGPGVFKEVIFPGFL
jgi:hypothetical protein